jgi:hypothetical protein
MAEANLLTAEEARRHLSYSPETGEFRWLVSGKGRPPVGSIAGCLNGKLGYWVIGIHGRRYWAHRLAWLVSHGEWPANQVDHINGNRADNRLVNLRAATHAENQQNRHTTRGNKHGFRGVFLHQPTGKFVAQCRHLGKRYHFGSFDTPEAANAAYLDGLRRVNPLSNI